MVEAPRTLVTLLEQLVDYAGLFPPAALDMGRAVELYEHHLRGRWAWALGKFVVPASRLAELAGEAARRAGRGPDTVPCWRLTALGTLPLDGDAETVRRFNAANESGETAWRARVESIEVRATTPAEVEAARRAAEDTELFMEMDFAGPVEELLSAAATNGCRAKIRTGGVSAGAFPSSPQLAAFLEGCARRALPFKATAGMHHPVRSLRPLSGEAGSRRTRMHGFLNVFVASALLHSGKVDAGRAERVLDEDDASRFRFDNDAVCWDDLRLTHEELAAARKVALGFGSCSFDEPIEDLTALGLLGIATP